MIEVTVLIFTALTVFKQARFLSMEEKGIIQEQAQKHYFTSVHLYLNLLLN